MRGFIFSFFILFLLVPGVSSAEALASKLKGQVVADNPVGLRVFLKDSENVILDMTDTGEGGVYLLDLTVMDNPTQSELQKLYLEVRQKNGKITRAAIRDFLNVFDQTSLMRPVTAR